MVDLHTSIRLLKGFLELSKALMFFVSIIETSSASSFPSMRTIAIRKSTIMKVDTRTSSDVLKKAINDPDQMSER